MGPEGREEETSLAEILQLILVCSICQGSKLDSAIPSAPHFQGFSVAFFQSREAAAPAHCHYVPCLRY